MHYLLYYSQYMQVCQTTCFCYYISKTKNKDPYTKILTGPYTKIFTGRYTKILTGCAKKQIEKLKYIIQQIVHGTKGLMAVYGPGCHPQNIIWTEAKLRSIYYFVGDRPVDTQYHLPNTCKYFRRHVVVIVYLRQKTSSDKIRKKTLY